MAGGMDYSYNDVLGDLLPALPKVQQDTPKPVAVDINLFFTVDNNIFLAWESEKKAILNDDSMWVSAQVQVQPGQNVKFRLFLGNNDVDGMSHPTPIKLRWTVSLKQNNFTLNNAGRKSCFVPIPVGDSIHKSASIQIAFNDIPRDMRRGVITSEWKINAEWFAPHSIGDDQQKASLSLHHIADVLEDKHTQ